MGRRGPGESATCTTLESWAVADALASLRPDLREVIVETYFLERSVAAAAVTLGIPEETVKFRAYYALKMLKLALAERGLGPDPRGANRGSANRGS